ncbi:zinc metallopeptidase [candidate division KSB1 bacterium]|nr:zinc metallopeptidase [candidate division KSB1 bacterium]MBL7093959.1 zinc metallopeptidase [candidate division KSB1 bacterium]
MFFLSPTDILLLGIGFVITMYAQTKVKSTFARYSKVRSRGGLTGAQVAGNILSKNGIYDVQIEETQGRLSDHYDPVKKKLRLSSEIYHSTSVAALGVAAHEAGHAIQHKVAYAPLNIRHGLFPIANIGSSLAMPLFIIGLFFQRGMGFLMDIGIYLFLGAVVFQLVTLPVEFNASKRALHQLETGGYLARDEIGSAKRVLSAAALTYVAAAAVAIMHLVRLLLIRGAVDE